VARCLISLSSPFSKVPLFTIKSYLIKRPQFSAILPSSPPIFLSLMMSAAQTSHSNPRVCRIDIRTPQGCSVDVPGVVKVTTLLFFRSRGSLLSLPSSFSFFQLTASPPLYRAYKFPLFCRRRSPQAFKRPPVPCPFPCFFPRNFPFPPPLLVLTYTGRLGTKTFGTDNFVLILGFHSVIPPSQILPLL